MGFAKMIGFLLIVFGMSRILTSEVSERFGLSRPDASFHTFAVIMIPANLAFYMTLFVGRIRRGGAILADCGHHPARPVFIFNMGLLALLILQHLLLSESHADIDVRIIFPMFLFLFCAVMSMGRLQIAENVVWHFVSLWKWRKFESYEWKDDKPTTLLLRTKDRPWELKVPADRKEAVARLLEQKIDRKENGKYVN